MSGTTKKPEVPTNSQQPTLTKISNVNSILLRSLLLGINYGLSHIMYAAQNDHFIESGMPQRANIFLKIKTISDWCLNLTTLYFLWSILRTLQFMIFCNTSDQSDMKKGKKWFKSISRYNHTLTAISTLVCLGYFVVARESALKKGTYVTRDKPILVLLSDLYHISTFVLLIIDSIIIKEKLGYNCIDISIPINLFGFYMIINLC